MNINKVIPNLYIGDIRGAQDLQGLRAAGVTHILQALGGVEPMFKGQFTYKVLNVLDTPSENLQRFFPEVVKWIAQAIQNGGTVFVHCWAGISRSSTCVIAYLMNEMKMPLTQAQLLCRKGRPVIYPNPGFQKQLQDYERQLNRQRFQQDQHFYVPPDYTTVSQKLDLNQASTRRAGLRSDWHQLNQLTSQDRLGANGLVNKGVSFEREQRQIPSFEEVARRTKLNESYAKKWYHNDTEKPHHYYTQSYWDKTRGKSFQSTNAPDRYSGHPISSLSANIMATQNQQLYDTIKNRQRELQDRQQVINSLRTPQHSSKFYKTPNPGDLERVERSIKELKRAFSGHSRKLHEFSQADVLRIYKNQNPNSALGAGDHSRFIGMYTK